MLSDAKERLIKYYKVLCEKIPGFKEFELDEFRELWTVVNSRNFNLDLDDGPIPCMVPFADMINHKAARQAEWDYDKVR